MNAWFLDSELSTCYSTIYISQYLTVLCAHVMVIPCAQVVCLSLSTA